MNEAVEAIINAHSSQIAKLLLDVRTLIYGVAEKEMLGFVEESLKWGEPSYIVKGGTSIRFDWKKKQPDSICIFVNCQTRLIETYRELYGDALQVEGKRAIILPLHGEWPINVLKDCILLALTYHKVKHLPLLGR